MNSSGVNPVSKSSSLCVVEEEKGILAFNVKIYRFLIRFLYGNNLGKYNPDDNRDPYYEPIDLFWDD